MVNKLYIINADALLFGKFIIFTRNLFFGFEYCRLIEKDVPPGPNMVINMHVKCLGVEFAE